MQPLGSPNNTNIITIDVPQGWADTGPVHSTGPNLWARTGCRYDVDANLAQCETGTCGASLYDCSAPGVGLGPTTTFTEWNFYQPVPLPGGGMFFKENFDISAVNGASLNIDVQPVGGDAMDPGAVGDDQWINYAYPLTVHGDDPRNDNRCPATFQLKRSSITLAKTGGVYGFVILNNNGQPLGGDNTLACLNNCGFYKFPTEPAADCDRTQPRCLYWNTFCAPNPGGKDYGQPCNTDADCKQYGLNAACWNQHLMGPPPPGSVDHTCQLRAFYANQPAACPTTQCTYPYGYTNSLTGQQVFSTQPPAGLCSQVAINGDDPSKICVGDDTIHKVLNKVYTWPNDPEVFGGDSPLYRIVFAPGGGNAPITAAGPIPLCKDLPSTYGYDKVYGGPNSNTKPCDITVNQQGAQFAVARPSPDGWGCKLNPGDSGNSGVICRWHAATPTGSPSPTSTPTPTPTPSTSPSATPTTSPSATPSTSPSATPTTTPTGTPTTSPSATPTTGPTNTPTTGPTSTPTTGPTATPTVAATIFSGDQAKLKAPAGGEVMTTFQAMNDTAVTEMIGEITIRLGHPKLFSSLGLSANGQEGTGNPLPPAQGNVFTFSPPISLPSGASVTFTFTGTIAQKNASISPSIVWGGIAYAADGRGNGGRGKRTGTSPYMMLAILILMAGATIASASRKRRLIIAGSAILLAISIGGCGGSSGGAASSSSSLVEVTNAGTQGPYVGLPLKIATVSKIK